MADNVKNLFRADDESAVKKQSSYTINKSHTKVNDAQRRILGICRGLSVDSRSYKPDITIKSILDYIDSKNDVHRLLYSQISNYIFSLDEKRRGIFSTNIDKLLTYALDDNNEIGDECKKMVVKIYDHFQLAISQIENIKSTFATGIEETKDSLLRETKSIQKEYVAILGIFAAIVLAFVGGITFSSSVLQNINGVSIYRVILVALVIGLVLVNILYGLFYYIDRLVRVKSEPKIKPLFIANGIILVLIIGVIVSWGFGLVENRNKSLFERETDVTTTVTNEPVIIKSK